MKAGEDNPQAREEEGKQSLLGLERSSSLAGIPGIWGLGKLLLSMAPTRKDGVHVLQHEGIDYLDTYAPVLCLKNLCFLLAYAILMGYKIHSMDISNAFSGTP